MIAKIVAFFYAVYFMFSLFGGNELKDVMPEQPEFPIIDSEVQVEGTTRVMSFNVRCDDVNGTKVSMRRQIVADEILHVAPDSVGLQEATPEFVSYLKAALPGYIGVGEGRDGGSKGEHCCIFYNFKKWKLVDSGTFWLSETPDAPSIAWNAACKRIVTWAVLSNRFTGQRFVHINSHFDHVSELARRNSAEMIINYFSDKYEGLPMVFTADMNSQSNDAAYRTMMTLFEDTKYTAKDSAVYGTFHNCDPVYYKNFIIDYVLVTPGIEAINYRTVTSGIDGRFVSDHFPVYADLILPENGNASFLGRLLQRFFYNIC